MLPRIQLGDVQDNPPSEDDAMPTALKAPLIAIYSLLLKDASAGLEADWRLGNVYAGVGQVSGQHQTLAVEANNIAKANNEDKNLISKDRQGAAQRKEKKQKEN